MEERILAALRLYVLDVTARAMVRVARQRVGWHQGPLPGAKSEAFLDLIRTGLQTFGVEPERRQRCILDLERALIVQQGDEGVASSLRITRVTIEEEGDVVTARILARELSAQIGFTNVEQTKLATVVSELARNIVHYAGGGTISFAPLRDERGDVDGLEVRADDDGPGISNLSLILSGRYRSRTGMGMGLLGAQRLSDEMSVETAPGQGTHVRTRAYLHTSPRKPR